MAELKMDDVMKRFQLELGRLSGQLMINAAQSEADLEEKNDVVKKLATEIQRLHQVLRDHNLDKFIEPPSQDEQPSGSESVHPDEPGNKKSDSTQAATAVETAKAKVNGGESKP